MNCLRAETAVELDALRKSQLKIDTPPFIFSPIEAEMDALKRLQAETVAELDTLLPDRSFNGEL